MAGGMTTTDWGKMPCQVGHMREGSDYQVSMQWHAGLGGSDNASAEKWSLAKRKDLNFL
jgi:hypothetical protein